MNGPVDLLETVLTNQHGGRVWVTNLLTAGRRTLINALEETGSCHATLTPPEGLLF